MAEAASRAAPLAWALLAGALSWRVLGDFGGATSSLVLTRALPGPLARLAIAAAAQPLLPALFLAALPLLGVGLLATWAARAPGVSLWAAVRRMGLPCGLGALAAGIALAVHPTDVKPAFAALGYVFSWPALGCLAVALHLRRARALPFAAILGGASAALLLVRGLPLGWPGQTSWTWWAMLPARPIPALAEGLGLLASWWALAWLAVRWDARGSRRASVALFCLMTLLIARGSSQLEHYGPDKGPAALASEINTSFFQMLPGTEHPAEYVRSFRSHMAGFPMHGATHPPGWPLAFRAAVAFGGTDAGRGVARAVEWVLGMNPAVTAEFASGVTGRSLTAAEQAGLVLLCGWMLLAWMLVPAATYFVARAHQAPGVALRVAAISGVVCAPALFFPNVDLSYPALALLGLGAWLRSERRGRARWALLTGVSLAVLGCFSFGSFSLFLVPVFQLALGWRRQRTTWGRALPRLLWLLVGPGAVLAVALAAESQPWSMFLEAMRHHRDTLAWRSGPLWMLLNPLDLVALMGIPLVAWIGRASPWWVYVESARKRFMDPEGALFVATLLTLVLLNFSGGVKGEAGRLWMPAMALLVAASAPLWRERRRAEWATLLALQLLQLILLKGFYAFVWLYS